MSNNNTISSSTCVEPTIEELFVINNKWRECKAAFVVQGIMRKCSLDNHNNNVKQEMSVLQQLVMIEKELSNEDLDQMIQKIEDDINITNNATQETNDKFIQRSFNVKMQLIVIVMSENNAKKNVLIF